MHKIHRMKGRVPILLFHDVNPLRNEFTGSITPEEFELIILFLARKYSIEPLDFTENKLDSNACYITFDDGMYNFLKYAFPIISKYRIPVTLFIPPESIDSGYLWTLKYFQMVKENKVSWQEVKKSNASEIMALVKKDNSIVLDDFRLMNWGELGKLDFSLINLQSHSNTHQFLSKLNHTDKEIELRDSRDRIRNNFKHPIEAISYPFGDFDKEVVTLANKYYSFGFITSDRMARRNLSEKRYEIPRFHIHNGDIEELYLRISGTLKIKNWIENLFVKGSYHK